MLRHHVQVDVKFPDFKVKEGKKIQCIQYTVINDAMRIFALKIYERHITECYRFPQLCYP